MSIKKTYSTVDTLRTFAINRDEFHQADTIFVTPEDFTMTESQFADVDYWYTQLGINIFPIHNPCDFQIQDNETGYKQSLQDFTLKTTTRKYRHKIKYNISLDYHKLLSELSTQKLNVIYASGNVLRAVQLTSGLIKGFETSAFELEEMLFSTFQSLGNSDLFIELADSDELNVYGYETTVSWLPSDIDRLVLNISLVYSTDTITMSVKYLDENITGIQSSDITLTDDYLGTLTFSTFIPGDGIYQMISFKDSGGNIVTPTVGCLYIQSTIYIGQKRYRFTASVITTSPWILLGAGDNFVTFGGDQLIFFN
jgi:hypothetical protein